MSREAKILTERRMEAPEVRCRYCGTEDATLTSIDGGAWHCWNFFACLWRQLRALAGGTA